MKIDEKFIENFENQIKALASIEGAARAGIERATEKLEQMKAGKSMEQVFGPAPRSSEPSGSVP